jgi:hypothetical protein
MQHMIDGYNFFWKPFAWNTEMFLWVLGWLGAFGTLIAIAFCVIALGGMLFSKRWRGGPRG